MRELQYRAHGLKGSRAEHHIWLWNKISYMNMWLRFDTCPQLLIATCLGLSTIDLLHRRHNFSTPDWGELMKRRKQISKMTFLQFPFSHIINSISITHIKRVSGWRSKHKSLMRQLKLCWISSTNLPVHHPKASREVKPRPPPRISSTDWSVTWMEHAVSSFLSNNTLSAQS